MSELVHGARRGCAIIHGARCALGATDSAWYSIQIHCGRILGLSNDLVSSPTRETDDASLNLSGFMVLPGLVNAHDHLHFALYPKLGHGPYDNYVEWGADIHTRNAGVIATQHTLERPARLWWGGLRNLLAGVTTVCHHDPLWPSLKRQDFPVRVLQEYGWAHSLALGGNVERTRQETPYGAPFIMHAGEGVDDPSRQELYQLDAKHLLGAGTVLVHGLAFNEAGVALLNKHQASLIVCPSSNEFLFNHLPSLKILDLISNLSLGSDSPLTADGDLLDEIRFLARRLGIHPDRVYAMVTEAPASALRLRSGEGTLAEGGVGDLIAVRDKGLTPADTLTSLSAHHVEMVMIGGSVQLASDAVWRRLPPGAKRGLEPLWIDGTLRWLRAPVGYLLRQAESVLGEGLVRLGGRAVHRADMHLAGD